MPSHTCSRRASLRPLRRTRSSCSPQRLPPRARAAKERRISRASRRQEATTYTKRGCVEDRRRRRSRHGRALEVEDPKAIGQGVTHCEL